MVRLATGHNGDVYMVEWADDLPRPNRLFGAGSLTAVWSTGSISDSSLVLPSYLSIDGGYFFDVHPFCGKLVHSDEVEKARLDCLNSGLLGFSVRDNSLYVLPRPSVKVDERNRVHCDDGPAVTWPSGKVEYWLHGVRVPEEAFRDEKELGLLAVSHGNAEVRRVLTEKYGLERLMSQLGNQVQEDETGALWKLTRANANAAMVEVKNSTPEPDGSYRTYMLRVPPTVKTAKEGVAWTFGMREKDYHPEVQT